MMKPLEAECIPNGTTLNVKLSGCLDESTNLGSLVPAAVEVLILDMEKITRCNSTGILRWTHFLKNFSQNARITLRNVPPMIVHQMNIVPAFLAHPKISIESFFVEFVCDDCNTQARELLETSRVQKLDAGRISVPEKLCKDCGKPMELDALPEKHFLFLKRTKAV